ncbi:cobalt-precorrin-8 methylmutase [Gammaproteobacteria bacterium ESL0073]|uniref:Cobalt-precorrin-8 methylmutase n=1 Tax=Entomomonas moraniae TaxID=2213226 RepID=A0A3Q9JHX9_9GAMM|nr:cobalt-precorrin-8 methylmutase [Entomomonas moraniae]AWM80451.1 cobalt-precorrin-8 methylmutase [Gammaproteobacteria bacterium ESL0073]AZS49860.1 cobalt-precorrin-8 methylmutase [Entomomonas moraniae]
MTYITQPQNIEDKSFEIIQQIIEQTRPDYQFKDELQAKIIKRCVHTSADFDWLDILKFSSTANQTLLEALQRGATIYTDTNMVLSGMNKTRLDKLGCQYRCYVADPITREIAHQKGITRSMAAVEQAANEEGEKIFVFGNAPTALFRLLELYQEGRLKPSAVVGVPVGFVGAEESKDALMQTDLPYIAAQGRKGGSNIAAAIMNALLYSL